MIITSHFKPAWWLSNRHGQTVYATLFRKELAPVDKIERIDLPDGDFIDLAWCAKGLDPRSPLVVLLHGLGGNVQSKYIAGFMNTFRKLGWRSVMMHFRGASSEPNRHLRAYHSGDTADLHYILQLLSQREENTPKAALGISLGGNILLKWLGEVGCQSFIKRAVAISVPFQIRSVADRLGRGFSRLYQIYLLTQLREIFAKKIVDYSGVLPEGLQSLDKLRCFWTFDEYVTAPLNGFKNVHAYYRKTSCRHFLKDIATPTLILHAIDDPFMTSDVLPNSIELSTEVTLELSEKGGHVGFISGHVPFQPVYWLEKRVPEYLEESFL